MTEDEARKLAQRLVDTWPNGPKAYIWRDALIDLEPHYAAATYRRLLTEHDKPTVARFHAEYHALNRPADNTLPFQQATDVISLTEYLERLTQRAEHGNTAAAQELTHWHNLVNREPVE